MSFIFAAPRQTFKLSTLNLDDTTSAPTLGDGGERAPKAVCRADAARYVIFEMIEIEASIGVLLSLSLNLGTPVTFDLVWDIMKMSATLAQQLSLEPLERRVNGLAAFRLTFLNLQASQLTPCIRFGRACSPLSMRVDIARPCAAAVSC